jgi:dTDP-4-amino-4,6-dideoxygalactose transaminase
MRRRIPFSIPTVSGNELPYINQAVTAKALAGDGEFTRRCESLLEERFAIHRVLMTPSCTAALEMAAMLCDFGPGDEVIMPSFTFVSTANAVIRLGARVRFVDIRPDTLNLDETLLEDAITPSTKAIVPVHYAGVACAMDRIIDLAAAYGLSVIEDAAQGVGAYHDRRSLGSIGQLGAYSFHATKNIHCGEGGALCINSPRFTERAEILRDKGTNRRHFLRGEVDRYTWVDIGSSYTPSEIACAFLCAQLEKMEDMLARRRMLFENYRALLGSLESAGVVRLPYIPDECRSNYHIFFVLVKDAQTRELLTAHLARSGIEATFHYVPLHSSPMGERFGQRGPGLPVTEDVSRRLLRLPLYHDLTEADQRSVAQHLVEFFDRSPARVVVPAIGSGIDR